MWGRDVKVYVRYIDGTEEVYEDVFSTAVTNGAYYLWAKKYPSLPHNTDRVHLASIPLTSMTKWREDQ